MDMLNRMMTLILVVTLVSPVAAQTSSDADAWRTVAQRMDVGRRITLRLQDGQRVHGTLINATSEEIVVQPRTRIPVVLQRVPYTAIQSLERDEARGIGAGKAVAIGVAAGAGAFFGLLLIALSSWD